ncbi:MAG TPA: tetratricopeptide repeat protein [Chlamydiales bacterium]|nr:tetratricopeptide repeat protein [Chlamydiales bacterium]
MSIWKKYKDDFIMLLEAGFIAVNQADEDAALKLFRAAELLDPDNVMPKVGFGYLHLHKLELKQAVKMFEDVLHKDPTNEMAKAFLGLCMSMMPNTIDKGEKILEQTLKSKDPMIKRLAGTAIDFVEKFIKKNPGPAGKSK